MVLILTKVIIENENLIYKIMGYFSYYSDKDDLYQAGCKGLIEAYRRYDETKAKFSTYAYSYILGEMRNVVRQSKSIKVSKEINTLKNKIERVIVLLTQSLMREPSISELSEYLGIDEADIVMALNSNVYVKSLDEQVFDGNMNLEEVIASKDVDKDTLLCLKFELENLEEPERSIMIGRYYEDLTQTEIANSLGLSQVDVSRREKKVLTKLRQTIN